MASAKDNMKALLEQRDRLQADLEALRNRIAGLDMAIAILQGATPTAKTETQVSARRSGVKAFVLDLLQDRGAHGLNAAIAVEIASARGVLMDRASVSSLLSRLKQDGIVSYGEDNMYRLAEFTPAVRDPEIKSLIG